MTHRRRRAIALAVTTVVCLGLWGYALSKAGSVPSPIAVHWGFGSEPNGTGSVAGAFWLSGIATLVGVALPLVVLRRSGHRTDQLGIVVGLGAFLATMFAGVLATTIGANAGKATWQQATLPGAWALAVLVLASAVGIVVARIWGVSRERVGQPAAAMELAPSHQAVWIGQCRSRLMAVIAVVTSVVAIVGVGAVIELGSPALVVLPIVMGVTALATAAFTHVTVTVDGRGLRTGLGLWGWPVVTVPLAKVGDVESGEIVPMEWGGWGYRGIPGTRTAIVLRRGPGIIVHRTSGALFAVTVDDADAGASLLAALAARPADGSAPSP